MPKILKKYHKMRGQGYTVRYFQTASDSPRQPPPIHQFAAEIESGDLYIHKLGKYYRMTDHGAGCPGATERPIPTLLSRQTDTPRLSVNRHG